MRKIATALLVLAGLVLGTAGVEAQIVTAPFTAEFRGGAALPFGDLEDEPLDAGTGYGFGVGLAFRLTKRFSAYGEYTRFEFPYDGEAEGAGDYVADGFGGGVKLSLAPTSMISPWIRGGAVYHDFSVDDEDDVSGGEQGGPYRPHVGFEAGAGLDFALGLRVSVVPAVRFVTFSPRIGDGGESDPSVSYLSADLGLGIRF